MGNVIGGIFGTRDSEKVKVSVTDTLADFLYSKLAAGANITLSKIGTGNEQVQVAAAGGSGDLFRTPDYLFWVVPVHPEITDTRYQSYANAETRALALTPAATKRFGILVGGNNSEAISVESYVVLMGVYKSTRLTGAVTSNVVADFNNTDKATINGCDIANINPTTGNMLTVKYGILRGGTALGYLFLDSVEIFGGDYSGLSLLNGFRVDVFGGTFTNPNLFWSFLNGGTFNGASLNNCRVNSAVTFNDGNYNIYNSYLFENITVNSGYTVKLENVSGTATITVNSGGTLIYKDVGPGITIVNNGGTVSNHDVKIDSGATRPTNPLTVEMFFDTNLGKPIWYDGANWVDATGTTV